MANNNVRLPMRYRNTGPQRIVDENAVSKQVRQSSGIAGAARAVQAKVVGNTFKSGPQRPALGEVTTVAVNRKPDVEVKATGKENVELALKRGRASSIATTGPQRVPLGTNKSIPVAAAAANARTSTTASRPVVASRTAQRIPVPQEAVAPVVLEIEINEEAESEDEMDIEEAPIVPASTDDDFAHFGIDAEIEKMVDMDSDDELFDKVHDIVIDKAPVPRVWPDVSAERARRYHQEVDEIRETFDDEVDPYDTTMVSEYAEDIFEYMADLEENMMPDANYMAIQSEITWEMRQTLVDWLLQVHLRYHMLPETLWIAVNIVDRFLSKRTVSLLKLQLVGVTAMFIAAKYEEILAPSVDEFVYMTERGYTRDEILKGERIVLQVLEFKVSQYCSPYSWMRKISKADDYDIQTRTLSKFLIEVTLLDHRFLRVKPSLIAAIGMYTSRRMLGGDWNEGFVYHSGFTEEYLLPGHQLLVEKLAEKNFTNMAVCQKYAHKKFLKASLYAIEWSRLHINELAAEQMSLE